MDCFELCGFAGTLIWNASILVASDLLLHCNIRTPWSVVTLVNQKNIPISSPFEVGSSMLNVQIVFTSLFVIRMFDCSKVAAPAA